VNPISLRPVVLLYAIIASFISVACTGNNHDSYQGYVEGEYLHVASPLGGRLETLGVSRGQTVAAGDPLFILDQTLEAAAVAEAEQGVYRAENRLADISKGRRPTELAALEAKLDQARAAYSLARTEYQRREKLLQQKVIAREMLDRTRTEMEQGAAAVTQLSAELETAKLGARTDEIEVARADVAAARERLAQARWSLAQKSQLAPQSGLVHDTFYVQGEYVPPAYPVVSILPPGNIKVRFFVPEPIISTLAIGAQISVMVDGVNTAYPATISYISSQAEYTPPVIYSRESRAHLVFMVEAVPGTGTSIALHPGQPVDVRLGSPDA